MRSKQPTVAGVVTALIYTRVSSDEQAREGVSLDAQLTDCRRYSTYRDWVLGTEFQDVMSGKRDDRPQYQAMLAEVRRLRAAGKQVVIVVARLDRFGRRLKERVERWDEFRALGVAVHAIREGGEVTTLMANFLAVIAQEEVERLGARVADARRYFVRGGWWPVGEVPWGYRLRDATTDERRSGAPTRVLEPDPETAPFLYESFVRSAAGRPIREIARWVIALPSPARGGRSMSYQAVRQILRNPVYAARFKADGPPQRWPALVDEETWADVRRQLTAHRRLPRQASNRYLLSGLLRCASCGTRMSGWSARGRATRYRCNADSCPGTARMPDVDSALLAEVELLLTTVSDRSAALRGALDREWERLRTPASADDVRIRRLRHQAERARERLTAAALKLVDGELDRAGYERVRDQLQADLDSAEAELARLGLARRAPSLPPLQEVLEHVGDRPPPG